MNTASLPKNQRFQEATPRQQLVAVCGMFFILGIFFSTWAARIPAIRELAQLTPVTLGYALLAKGLGTVAALPLITISIQRAGAMKAATGFGILLIGSLVALTFSTHWVMLSGILFFSGMMTSGFNICINALGAKIEAKTGKSAMSRMHAWFGVGNFTGALMGIGIAYFGFGVIAHFWGIALFLLVILAFCYPFLPKHEPEPNRKGLGLVIPHRGLLWLGAICFLAASVEESVNNWVTLFFSDHVGTSAGLAPLGYATYAGSMLLMRLFGDRLKPRFGAKSLIIIGSTIAAVGILIAVLATNVYIAVLGFFAVGAGVALNFPMVFSAAGRESAVALASVATMGFIGGMASQPLMGFLVEHTQLTGGFLFIGLCLLLMVLLSRNADLLNKS